MGFKRFWLTLIIVSSLAVPAYSADIRTGGGHIIQDTGSDIAQKPRLNFTGDGITCSNDSDSTNCDVGTAQAPASAYYVAGHTYPIEVMESNTSRSLTLAGANLSFTSTGCKFDSCLQSTGAGSSASGDGSDVSFEYTKAFSVEFWGKATSGTDMNGTIVEKRSGNTGWAVQQLSGYVFVQLTNTNTTNEIETRTDATVDASTLKHYVITYSGSGQATGVKVYVNSASQTMYATPTNNLTASILNSGNLSMMSCQSCLADEIIIHDKELTQAQVNARYASGSGKKAMYDPDILRNHRFQEGSGTLSYSTLIGWSSGKLNGGLWLDGQGGLGEITHSSQIAWAGDTASTFEGWIYFEDTNIDRYILDKPYNIATLSGQDIQEEFDDSNTVTWADTGTSDVTITQDTGQMHVAIIDVTDPGIQKDITNLTASSNDMIEIRYTNYVGGPTGLSLFWQVNSGATCTAGFDANCSQSFGNTLSQTENVRAYTYNQETDEHTVWLKVTDADWINTITQLRVDFDNTAATGTFSIEYIRIYEADSVYELYIPAGDDDLRFCFRENTTTGLYCYTTTNAALVANTWYHVAVSYPSWGDSTINVYKNCTDSCTALTGAWGTSPTNITPLTSNQPLYFGGRSGRNWKGYLDEWAIWNTALSNTGTPSVASRYNSGSGTECTGSETNIFLCWHLNDTSGNIAIQVATSSISGLGNDSWDCIASTYSAPSSGPCRTIQGAIDKIPGFYNGSTTVYVASGTYFEQVTINGYHPLGDYSITQYGYTNKTPNSFSDVARKSDTSSGGNTNNFPQDARTLMVDASNTYSFLDKDSILKRTDSGKCGTGFTVTDWYPVEGPNDASNTQLSIVGVWNCSVPTTATYELYYDKDMATIHGGRSVKSHGVYVKDSTGINVHRMRIKDVNNNGIYIYGATVSELYSNVIDGAFYGIDINGTALASTVRGNKIFNNRGDSLRVISTSIVSNIIGNYVRRSNNAGLAGYYSSNAGSIQYNLAKHTNYAGFDYEQNFNTYAFHDNRSANNVHGFIVSQMSSINFTDPNVFTNNKTYGMQINAYSQVSTNLQTGVDSDIKITNNGTGLNINYTSVCQGSQTTGCSSWTYSGNTTNITAEGIQLNTSGANSVNPPNNNVNLYIKENANLYGASGVTYLKQSLGAHRVYSVTFDPASLAANSTRMETITVAGVVAGDYVLSIKKPSNTAGYIIGGGAYLATNAVYVTVANPTGSAADPASEAWLFLIGTTETATTTADCGLVARMQSGTEATIGIINKDAGCP